MPWPNSVKVAAMGVLLSACAAISPAPVPAEKVGPGQPARGERVYRRLCASCHGLSGDGLGPAAEGLDPSPRDFTRAVYAYRSTPTGSLPTDADLVRSILEGLPGTAMPGWRDQLSAQAVADLVAYLKAFSARFAEEEVEPAIDLPEPVPTSLESIARGQVAYAKLQCGKCHGEKGKGDGWAKEGEMKNDRGQVSRARDFTQGVYRSGRDKRDLYRVFTTGLDGTPMPAYEQSLPPESMYDLVNYLLSLEQPRGVWHWLTTPPRWYEPSEQQVAR